MAHCCAIKADGGRCQGIAITPDGHCYQHAPEHAQERKRNARRGGLSGGRGRGDTGMVRLEKAATALYEDVRSGQLTPAVGAVLVQTLNVRTRLWEAERKAEGVLTPQEMEEEVREVVAIVREHVKDPETKRAIWEAVSASVEALER